MKKEMLEKYLSQLGFDKNIRTLEDITKLIQAHEKTFAFSSFKILLKENISLDIESIYESIVIQKRGAYCFEHNKLFFEVLITLGFDVKFYLARMINNTTNGIPQTHRFTILNFENKRYIIDVGIGFTSPTVPVEFGDVITLGNLGISYTIKKNENKTYSLQISKNNTIHGGTEFNLKKCYETDFDEGHFYAHKHPDAIYVNNLVLSIITEMEIRSLRNNDYFKIYEDYEEHIKIDNIEQFKMILQNDFNVNIKEEEISFLYKKYL